MMSHVVNTGQMEERVVRHCDSCFYEAMRNASGKVHSVFPGAINILQNDRIYTLLAGFLDNGEWPLQYLGIPGSAYTEGERFAAGEFDVGSTVSSEENGIRIGNSKIVFEIDEVFADEDFRSGQHLHMRKERLRKALSKFETLICEYPRSGAAKYYLNRFCGIDQFSNMMQKSLEDRIERLVQNLEASNPSQEKALKSAHQLIGAGNGLTPSGDDFLCGLILAMRSLKDPYSKKVESYLVKAVEEALRSSRTTDISMQMLQFLVEDRAPRVYHQLIYSFSTGGKDMDKVVRTLGRIGHSSGLDMASGLATGYQIYLERGNNHVQ